MHPQLEQLDEQRTALASEANALLERGEYGPDEQERVAAIETELAGLKTRRDQIERILTVAQNPNAREAGADLGRSPEFMRSPADPWANEHGEVRDRALGALERADVPDEGREKVAELVEADDSDLVSRWTVASSNPSYLRAFSKLIRHPGVDGLSLLEPEEQRALASATQVRSAMNLTSANGGYLVPFMLDPNVILTNSGTVNPIRKIARVVTSATNVWHGVSSAGVQSEWLGEASEAADASPTVSQPSVTAFKGAAWVQASFELVHDSTLPSQLGALFADSKDRLEATAFATGNGTTQPHGIVSALSSVTASRVSANTNGTYGIVDAYNLLEALPARYRPRAAWLANLGILNRTRRFNEGSAGANASFLTDFAGDTPALMIGKPVYEFSEMTSTLSSATASNDDCLIIGDFSNYIVSDVVGTSITYEPLVIGSSRRPTGEVGWFLHWRVGADDVSGGAAFRILRV